MVCFWIEFTSCTAPSSLLAIAMALRVVIDVVKPTLQMPLELHVRVTVPTQTKSNLARATAFLSDGKKL